MNSLSVIIPVYNVEKYLKECVESISKELRPQDEIILINDGSKDNSLKICREYETDNIVVIDNENHGVSYTRNSGVEVAKGDYITFVDSDDYLQAGWRETVEKGMEKCTDIVYFGKSDYLPSKKQIVMSTLCIPQKKNLDLRAAACWRKLFRLEFIKNNKVKFDSDLVNGEDSMFCLDTLLCGASYSVQKADEFYYYRTNNESATHTFNEKYNPSNIKFIKLIREKLTKSGVFSAEEVKKYVDFLDVNGLCILAGRISKIENEELRKSKFTLFSQPEYIELYKNFADNELCRGRKLKTFKLLKNGKYEKVMQSIYCRQKLMRIIRKILK